MAFHRLVVFALVLAALAVYGCSDGKLSGGTYKLSQVSFSQDDCNLKGDIPEGHEIEVTVAEGTVKVYMAKDLSPPAGTIMGASFTAFSTKLEDTIPETNCRDMWIKKVTGKLVNKNTFTGVYEYTDKTVSGDDCADEEKIGFHGPVCTSTMTFTATKK